MTQTTLSIDTLTYRDVAKTIDHSLLRPELDDAFVEAGCRLALAYDVASVCVRPADVVRARKILDGTSVAIGTTIGFPHGNHLTVTKVFESVRAIGDGARELDMVIQIGALKSGRDADVEADIRAVVDVAHAAGAIVKVIFENAYLTDDEKVRACHLTEAAGGDFVKTSTGFAPTGATHEDLALMRANVSPHIGVKAAGGVRTLDALIEVMALGVTRVGATATATILDDFKARKAGLGDGVRAGDHRRGRLLMADEVRLGMLGSGFIADHYLSGLRYVPGARVVANAGDRRRPGRGLRDRPRDRADVRLDGRPVRRPRGRPRRHRPPQPPPSRGGPGRDRGAARASCARSRSAGTPRRPPRCSASSSDAGVFHGYMENEVFSPEVIKVAEMVASGALGRVLTMRAREGHSGPHAAHFWDAETAGGGAFLDMGCHCIEAARYIIGKDVRIAEVFAWGATLGHADKTTGEDNAIAILRFEDGRTATIEASWTAKGGIEVRNEVYCERGRIVHDLGSTPIRAFLAGAGRLPRREDRRRHRLGLPGRRRAAGRRLRRADAPLRRGLPRRRRAARDLRGRARRQQRHRRRLSLDGQRTLGSGRGPDPVRGGCPMTEPVTSAPALEWLHEATALLARLEATQADAIEQASQWCAETIAAGGLVHCFGTGHSRIPVEELFPRYGSYPGFNPMVELSMTFHTQVVGSNGQRQAMFIERTPGLAEVILDNFTFGPHDMLIVFSASGLSAVPVEMARGARRRGMRVVGVTSVAQSTSDAARRGCRQPAHGRGRPRDRPVHPARRRPHHDRRPGHPGGPRLDDHRHRHRQLHQGAHRSAARRARSDATGHHPGLGRRRRALADSVRRGLSRARTAHRRGHRRGGLMDPRRTCRR